MNINHIANDTLKLSPKERASLAVKLIESLDNLPEKNYESIWIAEAEKRLIQLKGNYANLRSATDVISEAKAKY